jgi:hypothetical protein
VCARRSPSRRCVWRVGCDVVCDSQGGGHSFGVGVGIPSVLGFSVVSRVDGIQSLRCVCACVRTGGGGGAGAGALNVPRERTAAQYIYVHARPPAAGRGLGWGCGGASAPPSWELGAGRLAGRLGEGGALLFRLCRCPASCCGTQAPFTLHPRHRHHSRPHPPFFFPSLRPPKHERRTRRYTRYCRLRGGPNGPGGAAARARAAQPVFCPCARARARSTRHHASSTTHQTHTKQKAHMKIKLGSGGRLALGPPGRLGLVASCQLTSCQPTASHLSQLPRRARTTQKL